MSPLMALVDAVRRRWIARQIIEFSAIGFAFGSVTASALIALCIARNQPATSLYIVMPTIGVVGGLILAFRSRPSHFETVKRIDQTISDDDLLSTAWQLLPDQLDIAWNHTILAIAADRAASVQPSSVLPRRIGKRGWSIIFMTTCVTSALAGLSLIGTQAPTRAPTRASTNPGYGSGAEVWKMWLHTQDASAATVRRSDHLEAKAETMVESRTLSGLQPPDAEQPTVREDTHRFNQTADRDSNGAGESRSRSHATRVADWTTPGEAVPPSHDLTLPSASSLSPSNAQMRGRIAEQQATATAQDDRTAATAQRVEMGATDDATANIPLRMRTIYTNFFSLNR